MKPDEARKLFNTYNTKMDAVSQDLKPEIQKAQKNSIRKEFFEPVTVAIGKLQQDADDLEKTRLMYSNPEFMLVSNAVRDAEKITPGDAALISSLPGLSDDMLGHLIGQGPKPGVLLACLNHTQDNADLRQDILNQVQIPAAEIKSCAGSELDCLNALHEAPHMGGAKNDPVRKLDLGYRMKTAQAVILSEQLFAP